MRIIAREHKGRRIDAPKCTATRPTSDRVRENVFNLVAAWVEDAAVLDLFAGSGAMGIEALSRGAARAVFVEDDAEAARTINANLDKLRMTGAQVLRQDVERFLGTENRAFDLIFCDPPYDELDRYLPALARHAARLLVDDGLLVLETSSHAPEPELPLETKTSRRYGSARITLLHR